MTNYMHFLFVFVFLGGLMPCGSLHCSKPYKQMHNSQLLEHLTNGSMCDQLLPSYQPYRTAYHFQPMKNWMNDPAGPMLHDGLYHLFYQYNPYAAVWGPPVWGHSTSTDLVNWDAQPIAIQAQLPSNMNGSWTGSTTLLPQNKIGILFTGYTLERLQVTNLALPKNITDPYLKEWLLVPENPVMVLSPKFHLNGTEFRDPSTAWLLPDGSWRVLVGGLWNGRGLALLYKSRDFVHWDLQKAPLYSSNQGMWECPDFFPVYVNGTSIGVDTSRTGHDVKHILKVSLDDRKVDVYTIGTYNVPRDSYSPDLGFENHSWRYDYGIYYASKSFYDGAKKRRVLLGWINESTTPNVDVKKGWAGIHAVPRVVWLNKAGDQLLQWPIPEINQLRKKPVTLRRSVIRGGSLIEVPDITAAQADVSLKFKIEDINTVEKLEGYWTDPKRLCNRRGGAVKSQMGPFGLLIFATKALDEQTKVFFRVYKASEKFIVVMCFDRSRSSLDPLPQKSSHAAFLNIDPLQEGFSLRTLIDRSVIECFGGRGKAVITSRVYPILAVSGKARLYVFNNGTADVGLSRFKAFSMRKATIS